MYCFKKFEDVIKRETLSEAIVYDENRDYTVNKINGEELSMAVEVIK